MRKFSYSEYSRKDGAAHRAVQTSYRAEREGIECAARAIAYRLANEMDSLRYRVGHPKLTFYAGGETGRITVDQDAEISKAYAIRILTLYRIGAKLHARFCEFLSDEFRWKAQDRERNAA